MARAHFTEEWYAELMARRRRESGVGSRESGGTWETEKAFQARIVRLARLRGWLCYHTWNAKGSEPGFPDLVLVRPGRLIFAELKTVRAKTTMAQQRWLSLLAHSVDGVETYCWRPQHWDDIDHMLT
jgi:hypothetical protein